MSDRPDWYYDEFQQVGTDYESTEEVRVYDERMQAIRDAAGEAEGILGILDLSPNATLIEIGTGTGEFAVRAAERCAKVYAVDISQVMLDYARQKAESRGVSNIESVRVGFLTYEHQGEPVDAVVSQLALHHLPDFWKAVALKRIADMLTTGGLFYLRDVVFSSKDYEAAINKWISGAHGSRLAEDITRHVKSEYSTLDWIMEGLLKSAGLSIVTADYHAGIMATYLCRK
jgi:putative AdoMet-dependent methyltransferase